MKNNERIVFEHFEYRIIEIKDGVNDLDEAVYSYRLEVWNPTVDKGWEFLSGYNSEDGFIGRYDSSLINEATNNPVGELSRLIKKDRIERRKFFTYNY
jgi:hypothetical protein